MNVWMDEKELVFMVTISGSRGRTLRVIVSPPYPDGESPPDFLVQKLVPGVLGEEAWHPASVRDTGIAIALVLASVAREWPEQLFGSFRRYDLEPFDITDVFKDGG